MEYKKTSVSRCKFQENIANFKFTNPEDERKSYDEKMREIFIVQIYTLFGQCIVLDNFNTGDSFKCGDD